MEGIHFKADYIKRLRFLRKYTDRLLKDIDNWDNIAPVVSCIARYMALNDILAYHQNNMFARQFYAEYTTEYDKLSNKVYNMVNKEFEKVMIQNGFK